VTKADAAWPHNYLPADADLRAALAAWLGGGAGAGEPSAGLLLALRTALVHPSCGPHNYERLAFYGDAVLKARARASWPLAAAAGRRQAPTSLSRAPLALSFSRLSRAQLTPPPPLPPPCRTTSAAGCSR